MKKLNLSNIVEGVRKLGAVKATFEHMQEGMIEGFASILKGLTSQTSSAVAIYGVVNSGSGNDYDISAGCIYIQGELFEVGAFIGSAPGPGSVPVLSIGTSYRPEDPVIYSDGNSFNTHENRILSWSLAAPGGGLSDLSQVVRLNSLINTLIDVPGQINAVIDAAPGALDTLNELAAALGDDPNFATTVTNALANKLSTAAGAVGDSNLATDAVSNVKIQNGAVDANKLATDAVTNVKIQNGAVGNSKIADNSVSGAKVDDSTVMKANDAFVEYASHDWNLFSQTGFYYKLALGDTNSPGNGAWLLFVLRISASNVKQLAIGFSDGTTNSGFVYSREWNGSSWTSWGQIITGDGV